MRMSKVAALVLIVGATSIASVSLARAASDCPTSVTVSDWGENSTGYFNVASGGKSRPQESAQDDKWSFCLTAGTLCPTNQERQ